MLSRLQVRQRVAQVARRKKDQKLRSTKRLLFESLEQRMVLAADFVFDATNDQRSGFQFTLGSDGTHIELTDTSTGAIVMEQSLADNSGSIVIKGTRQAESLRIDSSLPNTITVLFVGGDGVDSLIGPQSDSDWKITGDNTGTLNGRVQFVGVENLVGAVDNKDEFRFSVSGKLSGKIDGGARGFDTLVVEGSHSVGRMTATGPHSGTVSLDGALT